ncbi:MAG TPA: hypothetical protein VEL11_01400, partial [Candidatus Bathyarchaeia archaeon]|nr:hypothetical protein [Candidatus Bathyarchaeia archaeon]
MPKEGMYMEMSIEDMLLPISPVRTFGKFNFVYNRPEHVCAYWLKLKEIRTTLLGIPDTEGMNITVDNCLLTTVRSDDKSNFME